MKEDCSSLISWLSLNQEPDILKSDIPWYPEKVITANKNGAFGKAILIAINSQNPQDFYTTSNVGYGENITVNCQHHHIFPDARYKKKFDNINSVFNFTFLTAKSNLFIKDKGTSEYINNIYEETQLSPSALAAKLRNHFIDDRCLSDLESEDLKSFLLNRADNLYNFFKNEVGVRVQITTSQQNSEDIVDLDDDFVDEYDEDYTSVEKG
jgi:hypothetical protein